MGMRTVCARCGKACLGFWVKDGRSYCGGAKTKGCGQDVGAELVLEVDRKRETLAGREHSLRNHGHTKVGRDEVARLGKGGRVVVKKMTAAQRKAAGL